MSGNIQSVECVEGNNRLSWIKRPFCQRTVFRVARNLSHGSSAIWLRLRTWKCFSVKGRSNSSKYLLTLLWSHSSLLSLPIPNTPAPALCYSVSVQDFEKYCEHIKSPWTRKSLTYLHFYFLCLCYIKWYGNLYIVTKHTQLLLRNNLNLLWSVEWGHCLALRKES